MGFHPTAKCTLSALILLAFSTVPTYASDFENRYYAAVLSGDLSWVIDAAPETPSGLSLKDKFDEYFLRASDIASINELDDPLVRAIVRRYHDYWRQALLVPQAIEAAERSLFTDVADLISFTGNPDEVDSALSLVFSKRGFSYSGGRTTPLLDFVLWRNSRTVEFDVELTDTRQNVVVHFLDDVVVRGWSHFATFGHEGTGGWAEPEALYCVTAAYDVESEYFKNRYLRHEARHFVDFKRYPRLNAVDLEYRAKLTELAFSTDVRRLLRWFWQDSNPDSAAPHPLASWHVVHDMAETLDTACHEDAMLCLESASYRDLQAGARRLLVEHTAKLDTLGADTVTTTFAEPTYRGNPW